MADRQLKIDIDVVTSKAQQALKDSERDAKKLGTTLDSTKSSATRVAEAIEAMATASQSEMRQAEAAAGALASALGPEMVAKLAQSGESTEQWTMKLNALGLSFREIEDDADRLGAAIRRVDDARPSMDGLVASSDRAATGVRAVGHEADQSRSVLANMVGNSVQDLGQLGGVAGSAGVMIGQLGEYAADGHIKLGKLAALATPMALLAGVGALAADTFQDMAAAKAFKREQVDGYTQALKAAHTALGAIQSKLEDAGKIEVRLFDENVDITPAVAHLGLNIERFSQLVAGGKPKIDQWADAMRAAGADSDTLAIVLKALNGESDAFAEGAEAAAASAEFFGTKSRFAAMSAQEVADELKGSADRAQYYESRVAAAKGETADFSDGVDDATDSLSDLDVAFRTLTGHLDEREAWRNLSDAIDEFRTKAADGASSWADLEGASDDAVRSAVNYIETADQIPDEVKTELLAELDQGDLDTVLARLEELRKGVDVPVRLLQPGEVGYQKNAAGTASTGGQDFIAGENGPEIVSTGGQPARVFNAGESSTILRGLGRTQNVMHTSVSTERPATPVAAAAAVERTAAVDLAKTEAEAAADQRRVWALQYEFGEISREEYRKLLQGQVDDARKYETDQVTIRREMRALDREDEQARAAEAKAAADEETAREKAKNADLKAALDEREKIFADARARRAANDAAAAADQAMTDLSTANDELSWANADPKATTTDRASASSRLQAAAERAAEALYRRADTSANALGFDDDTVEWARMVRASLLGDAQAAPFLRSAIDKILVEIPALADGGIARARPGGTIVRIAEAGRDEAIVPLDAAGGSLTGRPVTLNVYTGADPNASVAALQRFARYNGGRFLTKIAR